MSEKEKETSNEKVSETSAVKGDDPKNGQGKKKPKKKGGKARIIIGVVCVLAAVICVMQVIRTTYAPSAKTEMASVSATMVPETTTEPEDEDVDEDEVVIAETEDLAAFQSDDEEFSVDFEALQAVNSDIYGWLQIDDTNIDYPVVQHPTNDSYYLNHNSDGNYSANGAIFSEETYNSTSFDDPVTVLYGHHMSSGAMFGDLQSYFSDSEFFESHQTIEVYTPDGLLEYAVFAAVPYDSSHLLYYNDFTDDSVFKTFFEEVLNIRTIGSQINEDNAPELGDRVLILSTCLEGNNTRRFLVMATLVE